MLKDGIIYSLSLKREARNY